MHFKKTPVTVFLKVFWIILIDEGKLKFTVSFLEKVNCIILKHSFCLRLKEYQDWNGMEKLEDDKHQKESKLVKFALYLFHFAYTL